MSKHTPGPWVFNWQAGTVETGNGKIVFEFADPQEPPQHNPNARLIAAAPEMVEVLNVILESMTWEEKRSGTTYNGVDTARALLARIEGEK